MLTCEVLLCAPKNPVTKGNTETNDNTVDIANGSSISDDSLRQHSANTEETSLNSDPGLLGPLLSWRAVKLAIETQSPKLLFSVCQALGSVGCVLPRVYLEDENKSRKSGGVVSTEVINAIGDNAHKDNQCVRCIKRISTVLIAMLRYGLVKVTTLFLFLHMTYFLKMQKILSSTKPVADSICTTRLDPISGSEGHCIIDDLLHWPLGRP